MGSPKLTEAQVRVLRTFADGRELTPVQAADHAGKPVKARANFSRTITELKVKGFLSLRWTFDALWYRVTPEGRAYLATLDAEKGR